MNITERARHAKLRRAHVIAAAVIAASSCAHPTKPPVTAGSLSDRDVVRLRNLDPQPDVKPRPVPRRTLVAKPHPRAKHPRPARIGWALTIKRGDPTPQQLARLRWCESGRDGSWAVNSSSGARGFYQFLVGTWLSVGGRGDPAAASLSEQTYRAVLLFRREGWRPWAASASCTGLRGAA